MRSKNKSKRILVNKNFVKKLKIGASINDLTVTKYTEMLAKDEDFFDFKFKNNNKKKNEKKKTKNFFKI